MSLLLGKFTSKKTCFLKNLNKQVFKSFKWLFLYYSYLAGRMFLAKVELIIVKVIKK
jgi:hypothetical protein